MFSSDVFSQSEEPKKEEKNNYYSLMTLGFNLGRLNQENDDTVMKGAFGFRYGMGYVMNRWINVGAGVGMEFYDIGWGNAFGGSPSIAFIPLYAEARGEFTNWRISPMYSLEVGYGFKIPSQYENWDNKPGGAYFRPALGWKFKKNENFASTVSLGYLMQHAVFKRDNSWEDYTDISKTTRIYQRYFIQFGFEF